MSRTAITPTLLYNILSGAPGAGALAAPFVAADHTNGNSWIPSSNDLLIATNTDVSPRHITITSVKDPYGRTQDITSYPIPAGASIAVHIPAAIFEQTDGTIWITADNALITLAVVILPGLGV